MSGLRAGFPIPRHDLRFVPRPQVQTGKGMYQTTLILCVLALLFGTLPDGPSEPEGKRLQFWKSPLSAGVPTYKLVVHQLHNPTKTIQAYQRLIEFLNIRLSTGNLDPEASRNCAGSETKRRVRKPEFLFPNPWQTLEAIKVTGKVRLS